VRSSAANAGPRAAISCSVIGIPPDIHPIGRQETRAVVVGSSYRENTPRALTLDGYLDLPFTAPNLSRDSLAEASAAALKAVLTGISWIMVRQIGSLGGSLLRDCDQVYEFINNQPVKYRHQVLSNYPFTLFPDQGTITFAELVKEHQSPNPPKVCFITKDVDRRSKQTAKAMATLDNHRVIQIEGPEYWRGFCLSKLLTEGVEAKDLSGLECFTGFVADEEMGAWKDYRSTFTQALNEVIGRGRQLQLARITPKQITLVVPDDGNVVYINFNNPDVARLPRDNVYGPELESLIRKWAFGRIEADKIEEAIVAQGKLVVVQEVKELRVISDPKVERYVADPRDLFLQVSEAGKKRYCIRVNRLCMHDLRGFLNPSTSLDGT
jgi:hypothetical protein